MRECLSCAFCSTLYMSSGGVLRLIISMTPPVKSCKASLMRPSPMASYDPQILQQQVEGKIAFSKTLKNQLAAALKIHQDLKWCLSLIKNKWIICLNWCETKTENV